jgi:hypothetical protein
VPVPRRRQQSGGIGIDFALLEEELVEIPQRGDVPGDGSAGHSGLVERINMASHRSRVIQALTGLQ